MPLSESEIAARIRIGKSFCRKFILNDRQSSARFRDATNPTMWIPADDDWDETEGGDVPQDTPVGQSNLLTTNIITKCAAIAIGDPDFYVTAEDADNAHIAREFLRAKWRLSNWVKLSERALQKRYVSGLGILAYLWDKDKRSAFEFVQTWDLALDPHTQYFHDVKWAARRIKMPLRDALARYGRDKFGTLGDGKTDDGALDRTKVEVWLYFDQESEVHIYDNKVLERDTNKYGGVPLLFLEGDIDPGTSIWPLGDSQIAAGLQAELSDLNSLISNSAKHGGALNLVNIKMLGKGGQEALEDGQQQGYIPVEDVVTPPIVRIPGEPLSETLLEAKREAQQSIDSITGVNQYQRGVISQKSHFATEAALVGQQSGARGIQAQIEFERFVSRMAEIVILLEREFGGPTENHTTDEEYILWQALSDVTEVRVIESSTAYKDPAFEMQQAMQILNVMAGLFPIFQQIGKVPNYVEYANDILRASAKHDLARYWIDLPPQPQPGAMPPQGGPPQPGAPQGAQPGAQPGGASQQMGGAQQPPQMH